MKLAQRIAGHDGGPRAEPGLPAARSRPRGNMANHVRLRVNDRLEREAEDAGERALRGETGVARRLGRTDAASLSVPDSRADPLPHQVRRELEDLFGANLAAVRIHSDAAAAGRARDIDANAFTAGADIYFDAGRFSPHTPDGKRLLAHEIAHTLQQTSRATSGGQVRVTRVAGPGEIQRDAKLPPFADLRKLHKRGTDGTGKYGAVADELQRLLKATDSKTQVEQYARKNISGLGSWPATAESLLFDTLKSVRAWDTAAELIERDDFAGGTRILTAAQSGWVYDALEKRYGGSGIFALALEHSTLLKAYLEEFLRLIEVFVLQPINDSVPVLYNPQSKNKETIAAHVERHTKALEDNTVLKANEWFTPGLSIVRILDDGRVEKCLALQKAASLEPGRPEVFRKRPYASGMHYWGAEIAKIEMTTSASTATWRPQFQRIGKLVTGIGDRINKLWGRAQVFDAVRIAEAKIKGGKMPPDLASLIPVFDAAHAMAKKARLPERLASMLDKVNESDKHGRRPPAPEEYAERVGKLAHALGESWQKGARATAAAVVG